MIKRVTIFENGSKSKSKNSAGKVVRLGESRDELMNEINKLFNSNSTAEGGEFKILYTEKGAEISDIDLIRDDETLFASRGEPFNNNPSIKLPSSSNNADFGSGELNWIKLNVGGRYFYTSKTTLCGRDQFSMLARMFEQNSRFRPSIQDSSGAFLVDRDPRYFNIILNYLRTGELILDSDINPRGVYVEAQFFGISSILTELEKLIKDQNEDRPLTRRNVIDALISTSITSQLRFQGVNLEGIDLSYMDLRNCNFKYAKLKGANLSHCNLSSCNFERADLTNIILDYSTLTGVRMNGSIAENASCINCNFTDPTGSLTANLEGINLRNGVLEDSDLTNANLRVANLSNCNLKCTILRKSCLAGSNLQACNLAGSDLFEANLRGANLLDADAESLELMLNPLHMAQAL